MLPVFAPLFLSFLLLRSILGHVELNLGAVATGSPHIFGRTVRYFSLYFTQVLRRSGSLGVRGDYIIVMRVPQWLDGLFHGKSYTGWWFGTWLLYDFPFSSWTSYSWHWPIYNLVGGLEHDFYFSIYWDCHNPNWRTHIFQRGRSTTNQ